MPAETHSHREAVDVDAVLALIAESVGADPDDAAERPLEEFDLDGDLALLDLWTVVAEEFGERSLGELELSEPRPATLAELAVAFHVALSESGVT